MVAGSNFMRWPVLLLVISVLTGLIYARAVDSPFVLDDKRVVQRNLEIRDFKQIGEHALSFMKRPVVQFTFGLDRAVSGGRVEAYHISNLLIHIINSILVFFLIRTACTMPLVKARETGIYSDYIPVLASLLFAVHPLQTQAVIYISQRATLLGAMFYMGSVLSYLEARRAQLAGGGWLKPLLLFLISGIAAVAAFLSKQNTISLPLAVIMAELVLVERSHGSIKRKMAGLFFLSIVAFLMVCWSMGVFGHGLDLSHLLTRLDRMTRETVSVTRWQYLCTQFNVVLIYIRMIFWPSGLNIDHAYPFSNGFFDDFTPFACLILLGLLSSAALLYKKKPLVSFSIFWFFTALLVESSLIPIRDAMFEHRVYLAMPGAITAVLSMLCDRDTLKTGYFFRAAAALIIILACLSFHRAKVWESELTLWEDVVRKAPHNARGINNLGLAWQDLGRNEVAAGCFRQAIKVDSRYAEAYTNLGKYLANKGEMDRAEKFLLKAVELAPRLAEALNNLGVLYSMEGRIEKGLAYFKKSFQRDRNRSNTYFNLGMSYLSLDQPDKGLSYLMQYLSMEPGCLPLVYYNIAGAHAMKGNVNLAKIWLEKAASHGFNVSEAMKTDKRFKGIGIKP